MKGSLTAVAFVAALAGCAAQRAATRTLPPLGQGEGELYLYLEAMPPGSRLAFTVESVAAVSAEGPAVPLTVARAEVSAEAASRQRLLASGRLPAGEYRALLLKVGRATLRDGDKAHDLLVGTEASRVELPLVVSRGRASVVALALDPGRAVDESYRFTAAFRASVPDAPMIARTGYVTSTPAATLLLFDRHDHRVVGALPTGREPCGVVLDPSRNRAYVALAGDDAVQVIDLPTGTELGRVTLRNGDRPRELGLSTDGRTLLVVEQGSNALSFVDTAGLAETDRLATGEEPRALLLDRAGRRAYVLNHRTNSVTVVDVASRTLVTTLGTEAEPVRAQLNRAGDRLYLLHAGSPYMTVLSLPAFTARSRVFVGLGASALKVDPRSDLVYVGTRDEDRLQVFDPFSLLPVSFLEVPGGAGYLAIDDLENALLVLSAEGRSLSFVDLTSRRVVGAVDVGSEPYQLAVPGER